MFSKINRLFEFAICSTCVAVVLFGAYSIFLIVVA